MDCIMEKTKKLESVEAIKLFSDSLLKVQKRNIKAMWLLNPKEIKFSKELIIGVLFNDLSLGNKHAINLLIKKIQKEILNKYNFSFVVRQYYLSDYFEKIMGGDINLFNELKTSLGIYDPSRFFIPLRELMLKGKILGSNESINKLVKDISGRLKRIDSIKLKILSLLYKSVVDAGQAGLVALGYPMPVPRKVAIELKNRVVKKGLLSAHYLDYCNLIISTYKDYEHGNLSSLSASRLESLIKKSGRFVEAIVSLIEDIEMNKEKNEQRIQ